MEKFNTRELEKTKFNLLNDSKVMCAAVSVIWTHDHNFIMIKRAVREGDPWSGHIGFPGGRLEDKDNGNPYKTAIRETKEEIGVELVDLNVKKILTPLLPEKDFRGYKLELWPYLFKIESSLKVHLDKKEVQEIIKVPVDLILNHFDLQVGDFKFHSGGTYSLPYLQLANGFRVWGLSLMILKEINQIFK